MPHGPLAPPGFIHLAVTRLRYHSSFHEKPYSARTEIGARLKRTTLRGPLECFAMTW